MVWYYLCMCYIKCILIQITGSLYIQGFIFSDLVQVQIMGCISIAEKTEWSWGISIRIYSSFDEKSKPKVVVCKFSTCQKQGSQRSGFSANSLVDIVGVVNSSNIAWERVFWWVGLKFMCEAGRVNRRVRRVLTDYLAVNIVWAPRLLPCLPPSPAGALRVTKIQWYIEQLIFT